MKVKRIVVNFAATNLEQTGFFYQEILGLDILMDHGWIRTYGSDVQMPVQINFASEGGSATPVPDLSIGVNVLDKVDQMMISAGFTIEYGLVNESWGVRRLYVRDPFDRLINILAHV